MPDNNIIQVNRLSLRAIPVVEMITRSFSRDTDGSDDIYDAFIMSTEYDVNVLELEAELEMDIVNLLCRIVRGVRERRSMYKWLCRTAKLAVKLQ